MDACSQPGPHGSILSRRQLLAASGGALLVATGLDRASAAAPGTPHTIPALRSWWPRAGTFALTATSRIVVPTAHAYTLGPVADVLADDLHELTGRRLPISRGAGGRAGDLVLNLGERDPRVGREGYRMTVGGAVTLRAATPAGVFYGTRSLLQLLHQNHLVPRGEAVDWPRYPERGLMVDTGDKHFTPEWFASHLKDLAYVKCNLLHLHFSDNNGFRVQSDRHPEIVSADHLTKRQVRELVSLAERYFITVVPEIDMPGHMGAALAPHPDLQLKNAAGGPTVPYSGDLDVTKPAARAFARELVEEFLPLFPGRYWHLGGDEYMPSAELELFPQLATYARGKYGASATAGDAVLDFYNEMDAFVRSHHKTTRMWHDELNIGNVVRPHPDITVEWWDDRNPLSDPDTLSPQQLLDAGHQIMNCGWFPTYYDTGPTGKYVTPRPDMGRAYEQWEPHQFEGAFFSPTVAGQTVAPFPAATVSAGEPRNLGSKVHIWSADNEPDATTTAGIFPFVRVIAQKTWGSERLTPTYAGFQPIMAAVGRAPGWRLG